MMVGDRDLQVGDSVGLNVGDIVVVGEVIDFDRSSEEAFVSYRVPNQDTAVCEWVDSNDLIPVEELGTAKDGGE